MEAPPWELKAGALRPPVVGAGPLISIFSRGEER